LGEVRKIRSGLNSAIAASARSVSTLKSSARVALTHFVHVVFAMIGCIEYDGSKPRAVRPGPPYACSNCWSTSLDPLAAQTWSAARPCPRYFARSARNASASRSGYRFRPVAAATTASAMS
jgi:hypothetical protein